MDVGSIGKHGVEVRGYHQTGTLCSAGPIAEDVAHAVNPYILQPQLLERPFQFGPTGALVERRRRDLTEANLVVNGLRLVRLGRGQRSFDTGSLHEIRDGPARLLGPSAGNTNTGDETECDG
jgi:hypothetical protein